MSNSSEDGQSHVTVSDLHALAVRLRRKAFLVATNLVASGTNPPLTVSDAAMCKALEGVAAEMDALFGFDSSQSGGAP